MWGPQSSAVLVVGIVLAVAAVGGTLVAWSRVRGPAALRVLQRVGLVVLCQLTAVGVVGVTINRLDGFFATWTWKSGDLARTEPNNATERVDAQPFTAPPPNAAVRQNYQQGAPLAPTNGGNPQQPASPQR